MNTHSPQPMFYKIRRTGSATVLLFTVVIVVLASWMTSCKKDESGTAPPPGGNITVSGSVQAFGGQAIANAVVRFFAGSTTTGTPVAQDTTGANGQWQLTLTASGRYTCVVSGSGYPTAIVTVIVPAGQNNLNLGSTILAEGTLLGTINDAQTGQPVPSAVVRFFAGTNRDTAGVLVASETTDAQGQWSLTLTIGNYVCVVSASGWLPLVTDVPVTDTSSVSMTTSVTQPVPPGQMRIVLNWGQVPFDLDSHLTGDTSGTGSRYHVAYFNPVVRLAAGDTVGYLDVDDVTSYGPETITIFRFFPGTLRYKIHDYTNRFITGSHYLSDSSQAIVRVYTSAGLIREDRVVTGQPGNQWHVYNINGTTQAISFVNTIRDGVSDPNDTSFSPTRFPDKRD